MRKQINYDVGFADCEFVSHTRSGPEFTVLIDAWNGKRLEITFIEFEGVLDCGVGDISDFREETEKTAFFERVMSIVYDTMPDKSNYRLYQFLNLDGEVALEVVASGVEITIRK
jgi:hypothetical protein